MSSEVKFICANEGINPCKGYILSPEEKRQPGFEQRLLSRSEPPKVPALISNLVSVFGSFTSFHFNPLPPLQKPVIQYLTTPTPPFPEPAKGFVIFNIYSPRA